jgi:H+/Cl- antiporter ClcA
VSAGPEAVHLRSPEYLGLIALAAVLGVGAAIMTLAFLWGEHGLQALLWHRVPDALGVDPHPWYALAVTTLGGALVGLVIRFVPGHGGPRPTDGHGVGETHVGLRPLPGIVLASIVSLAIGASLGPEAPLLALVAAVGPWVALRMSRPALAPLFTQAGIGSVFALLFGSPLAATFVGLETIVVAGRALYTLLIPVLVASTTGFLGFRVITHHSLTSLANLQLPAYPDLEIKHFPLAIGIGAAGAVAGLVQIAAFRVIDRTLRPLDRVPIAKATLGGIGIGLVALIAGKETLFSGEHELDVLLQTTGGKSGAALLLIIAGKLVATSISMATGFRGGKIFPLVFIGGTLGIAMHEAISSIPLAVAVASGMAGATMAIVRLPVFVILFIAFFSGPLLVPLILVAAVTAYLIVFDKADLEGEPTDVPEPLPAAAPPGPRREE